MFWSWRNALFLGVGVVIGAVGATMLSSRPSCIRNGASTMLSHGLAAKRKAQTLVETAKENVDDLVAEADQKLKNRKASENN